MEAADPRLLNTGRVHSIDTFSTQDGPGVRFVLFMQGCLMRCQYCHNPDTWALQDKQEMSVDDILQEIEPFVSIYQASGGGMTVSGGEPLLQAPFLARLFQACKEKWQLHTALDTSGYHANEAWTTLLDVTDLVILDLKAWDERRHEQLTGRKKANILHFAEGVSERNIPLWVRHVLVPGITDDPEELQAIGAYIASLSNVQRVELLPYHKMGVQKWHALGWSYPLENVEPPTEFQMREAQKMLGINI